MSPSSPFTYITDPSHNPRVFRGSLDAKTPSKQIFDVPMEAQVVRIEPQKWKGAISLKVELVGCEEPGSTVTPKVEVCQDFMGLSDGRMDWQQVSVSSELLPEHDKRKLSVEAQGSWEPATNSPIEWVEV